jgi:hypothetical protein
MSIRKGHYLLLKVLILFLLLLHLILKPHHLLVVFLGFLWPCVSPFSYRKLAFQRFHLFLHCPEFDLHLAILVLLFPLVLLQFQVLIVDPQENLFLLGLLKLVKLVRTFN